MAVPIFLRVCLVGVLVGEHNQLVAQMEEKVALLENYNIQNQRHTQQSSAGSTGHAVICGPPNVTASLSWYPGTPSLHQDITFAVNITAPVGVSCFIVFGDIYMAEVKQKIFEFNYKFTCEKLIKKKVKITCPIKRANQYYVLYTVLAGELPMGSFKVHGKMQNQIEQDFLCFNMSITVTD